MPVRATEYREWRKRNGKSVDWSAVRRILRYRQEVRDLKAAGFVECRSFTCLPFDDQMGRKCIADTRIANAGKALWVRLTLADGNLSPAPDTALQKAPA